MITWTCLHYDCIMVSYKIFKEVSLPFRNIGGRYLTQFLHDKWNIFSYILSKIWYRKANYIHIIIHIIRLGILCRCETWAKWIKGRDTAWIMGVGAWVKYWSSMCCSCEGFLWSTVMLSVSPFFSLIYCTRISETQINLSKMYSPIRTFNS